MGWTGRRPWTLPVFGFSKAEAQVTERQWPEGEGSSASAGPPWAQQLWVAPAVAWTPTLFPGGEAAATPAIRAQWGEPAAWTESLCDRARLEGAGASQTGVDLHRGGHEDRPGPGRICSSSCCLGLSRPPIISSMLDGSPGAKGVSSCWKESPHCHPGMRETQEDLTIWNPRT